MSAAYSMELTLAMCTPWQCALWDRLRQVGATTVNILLPCCPYVLVPGTTSCCCCLTRDKQYRRRLAEDFLGTSPSSCASSSYDHDDQDRDQERVRGTNRQPRRTRSDNSLQNQDQASTSTSAMRGATSSRRASSPTLAAAAAAAAGNASCSHADYGAHVEVREDSTFDSGAFLSLILDARLALLCIRIRIRFALVLHSL